MTSDTDLTLEPLTGRRAPAGGLAVIAVLVATLAAAPAAAATQRLIAFDVEPTTVVGGQNVRLTLTYSGSGTANTLVTSSDPRVIPVGGALPSGGNFQTVHEVQTKEIDREQFVIVRAVWGSANYGVRVRVTPSPNRSYVIRGSEIDELVELARRNRFGFPVDALGDGRCEVLPQGVVGNDADPYTLAAVPPTGRDGRFASPQMVCEFGFLMGNRLNAGWTMQSVRLGRVMVAQSADQNQSGAFFSRIPTPNSTDAAFEVRVSVFGATSPLPGSGAIPMPEPISSTAFTLAPIDSIELEGPRGADWRDAFRRQ